MSKGPAATGPFHDSLRYPLLLIFPPDRVEVPGNAGHIHREAQDFKKQVHRLQSEIGALPAGGFRGSQDFTSQAAVGGTLPITWFGAVSI